jgi:DMSO/TMAO reductase YedYZ molybdopterin-dependent catalytic subunit
MIAMTDTAPGPGGVSAITMEELALAARNHGMPLEALRYDLTPVGLHYLLIHFDIPEADDRTWRLELGGQVAAPRTLTMEQLRRRPEVTVPVTLECAGNGRARLDPRPVSQPWLEEAPEWTGTPLRTLPPQHGYPLRLVVPGWYGMTSVKWLRRPPGTCSARPTSSPSSPGRPRSSTCSGWAPTGSPPAARPWRCSTVAPPR